MSTHNAAQYTAQIIELQKENAKLREALGKAIFVLENDLDYRPDDVALEEWTEIRAALGPG